MTSDGQGRLDPHTADALYAEHSRALKAFLISLLRDPHLAEEALQTTFGQALRSGGAIEKGSMRAWLFQVAYNEAMAIRRRKGIDNKSLRRIALTAPQHGLTPEWELVRREDIERVQRAVRGLPVDQQVVVRKRTYEQKTFAQIAEELQLPLGTVLTRMRLAIEKLRKALNEPD